VERRAEVAVARLHVGAGGDQLRHGGRGRKPREAVQRGAAVVRVPRLEEERLAANRLQDRVATPLAGRSEEGLEIGVGHGWDWEPVVGLREPGKD